MKSNLFTLLFIFLFATNAVVNAQVTIHTIGDSTMETQPEDHATGQRGWPQKLPPFLVNGAELNNRAKSGTSSKTFYEEERFWITVKPQIKEGDYVIIQFGHNDEKDGGAEGEIGTHPWQSYVMYLRRYVEEVRELGATPILFTPIVRSQWANGQITDKGAHNLGVDEEGKELDYVAAMKSVAEEMNCLLVDHTQLTRDICNEYGQAKTGELIYNVGDGTHIGEYGATLYARLAVQDLIRQSLLTTYLNASPDLMVSTTNYDFGRCYAKTSLTYPFSVSGADLSPEEGKVTIEVTDGFDIAFDQDGTYSQNLEVNYVDGILSATRFYVRYFPSQPGTTTGEVTISNGTITKVISLSGECVEFDGGQEAKVYWELSKNEEATVEGYIIPIGEQFSNMYVQRYAVPNAKTTWEDGLIDPATNTQRNLLVGDVWPAGEIDVVYDRYIQFGVTAVEGTILNIDSIGLYAGGAGGSGMRFRIAYSTHEDFSDDVVIAERQTNAGNTMYPVSSTNIIELKGGESLYLRIYPWYNGQADGKTICLYGVTIKGVVTDENGSGGTGISQEATFTSSCFPTVTSDKVFLQYTLPTLSDVSISINTLNGARVIGADYVARKQGQYQEELDLSNLPAGIYVCSLVTTNGIETFKIAKK